MRSRIANVWRSGPEKRVEQDARHASAAVADEVRLSCRGALQHDASHFNRHARRVMRSLAAAVALCCGCSGPILRPQSPEARIDLPPMPDVKYVSAYTHPYGMNYVKVEAVSLVTGLERHRLRSAADAAAGHAARRNESPRRGESERSARLGRTLRWCWCGRSCGPAFRKAIGSTSKFAFRPAAKRPASATAGCSRRG